MGQIHLPEPAKLFIGIIGINKEIIITAKHFLQAVWGDIDFESAFFNFEQTNYYKKEIGDSLIKKFFSFKTLISREKIVDIKIKTNELEDKIKFNMKKEGRDTNLDPGYLTLSRITLATTKDYRHRIYLNKGIYLENTLYYDSKTKSYSPWEWTYPDYRTEEYLQFFNSMRKLYQNQLKSDNELE